MSGRYSQARGRAQASRGEDSGGLLEKVVKNVQGVASLPAQLATGLPSLAGAGIKSAAGVGRLGGTVGLGITQAAPGPIGDLAEGILDSPAGRFVADEKAFNEMIRARAGGASPLSAAWTGLGETAPLVTEVPESFVDTGRRGLQLNMALTGVRDDVGVQDTEYGEAFDQGQLAPLVVEDAANLAAVAFGASKGVGAAARAARAGQAGTRSGRIARALAPHADDLGYLADSVGDAAAMADRAANPLTWPGAATKGVLRATNPRLANAIATEGRGSMLLYGARQSPRLARAIDGYTQRKAGRSDSLMADAIARQESQDLLALAKEMTDVDPTVKGAAVAAQRLGDATPVIRARLDAPGPDGQPLSREAQQAVLDEWVGNVDYLDPNIPADQRALLRDQQNMTLDEFELAERALNGDEAARAQLEPVIGELNRMVLDRAAVRRLNAEGERYGRAERWDDVPDDAGTADVVAQRQRLRDAESRVDDLKRRRDTLRRQKVRRQEAAAQLRALDDEFAAETKVALEEAKLVDDAPEAVLREKVDRDIANLDAAVEAGRMTEERAARFADLNRRRAAVQAKVDELAGVDSELLRVEPEIVSAGRVRSGEGKLLEAYQQRVGRAQEQAGDSLEVMVERDVADPVAAVQAGRMDEDVAGNLLALRQEAVEKGWGDPTLYGIADDVAPTRNAIEQSWTGLEFRELVDQMADEYIAAWVDEWSDAPVKERPAKPSRQRARNEAVRALGASVEIHIGNRPGEFVEVSPSSIRWNQLDGDAQVRVRGDRAAGLDADQVAWQAQWSETVGKHRARPENLPPQLRVKQRWVEKAVEDFTRLGEEYAAEGWDDLAAWAFRQAEDAPVTLSEANVMAQQVRGGVLQGGAPGDGTRGVRATRLGAEQQKRGVSAPNSVEGQLRLERQAIRQAAHNRVVREVIHDKGVRVGDTLPDGTVVSEEWLIENNYQPLTDADFGVGTPEGMPSDVWLSKDYIEAFRTVGGEVFSGAPRRFLRGYDQALGVWKTGVLALSPRWHVGNMVGNMMMAWMGEGVTPLDVARNWREAMEITGSPLGRRVRNGRLVGRDPNTGGDPNLDRLVTASNVDELLADTGAGRRATEVAGRRTGRARQRLNTLVDSSYNFNQFVDNFTHVQVYLKVRNRRQARLGELRRQFDAGELTDDQFARYVDAAREMTDEQAVRRALTVAGDFQNMAAWEKSIVRRAIPFVSWYKHITKLSFSLPFTDPARVAWTLHLAEMFDDDEERPFWLESAVGVGGDRYLQSAMMNPFGGVGPDENPLLNPSRLLGATSPAIQTPLQAFNIDTRQGGGYLSWAPGYGPTDSEGRQSPGFVGVPVLARQLSDQNPLTRMARQVVEDPVARFDSGQPILSGGRPIESDRVGGRLSAPLGLLGLTLYDVDVAEKIRDREERKKRRERERREYDRDRRRAGV